MNLTKLKKELERIAGQWNGDNSGIGEERSADANEALSLIKELEIRLKSLNINL